MKIRLKNCSKQFITSRGPVDAVKEVSLEIKPGEFFILLGPSGCGKSTILNLTAGLEKLSGGEILLGDRIVDSPAKGLFESPRQRNVAMVFQSYALYPHRTVFKNISFPLEIAKEKKEIIGRAVEEVSRMLGIEGLLTRKPAELSGGQRQRVAIARALVRRPEIFLLDEPLSNLDIQLRGSTRAELKRLQQELGITTLYVTHDQTEAMTLGDRIALLKEGSLVQIGSPQEVYERPKTPFAAIFIGSPPMNLFPAQVSGQNGRTQLSFGEGHLIPSGEKENRVKNLNKAEVLLGIRPEHVKLSEAEEEGSLPGVIKTVEPLGREELVHIDTELGSLLVLSSGKKVVRDQTIRLSFDPEHIHLFDPETRDD
jgi:multiple sugar transport system ATP-binding protein